jgi:NAD(P)H-flavin reductase/ferredoxin
MGKLEDNRSQPDVGGRALRREDLPRLFDALHRGGYTVVGPTVRDDAIVYAELHTVEDLPRGWTDDQSPGRYRLRRRDDEAYFGYAVGPHSWKRYVFAPREPLVRIRVSHRESRAEALTPEAPRLAFLGVKACELAALDIQDRVFMGAGVQDRPYAARRSETLLIAVDCFDPASTCFCSSMGTGPAVDAGFDLRLTELEDAFVVSAGTDAGRDLLAELPTTPTTPEQWQHRDEGLARARSQMSPGPDPTDTPGVLLGNLDHPRWDEVAQRCLACGNCTQSCPTCFCFNIEDRTVLGRPDAIRERVWDSCFGPDHSSIHGGLMQPEIRDRYRQWLTHKLGSWVTQFGSSGCVGCGRCITWCPVGIDIREEVAAISDTAARRIEVPEPLLTPRFDDDPLVPSCAEVVDHVHEHGDVYTLHVRTEGYGESSPGQFNMLGLPGVGDVPISIAGRDGDTLLHTIRAVGAVTRALVDTRIGDVIGVRGPFGSAWPLRAARGSPVVIIAGGIGLAPLRQAILQMLEQPEHFPSVRLLYGARDPQSILYDQELLTLNRTYPQFKASVTVDRAAPGWTGHVGVVTRLMRHKELPPDATYLLCGPEVMMRFSLAELTKASVPKDRVYVSVERNMKCAVGLCGRCQYGPYFACKDGPVFRHDQLDHFFGTPGF